MGKIKIQRGIRGRDLDVDWIEEIETTCRGVVAFHMKQMANDEPIPAHLMIREFPVSQ